MLSVPVRILLVMTIVTEPPTFSVRTPDDLIALAPVLLGFVPTDSVVLMAFGGPRPFQARGDLPPAAALDLHTSERLADELADPAVRHGADAVALLFYGPDPAAVGVLWRALRRRLGRSGIEIITALRVDVERYHPLWGEPRLRQGGVRYDVSRHPFTQWAERSGRRPHASRDAMVASLAADPDAQLAIAERLATDGHDVLPGSDAAQREGAEWAVGLIGDHLADGTVPGCSDLARLVWLLQSRTVTHAVWSHISRDNAADHTRFFSDALRRTPDDLVAEPAALLAWSAWQSGNGALAWAAVDRCREVDPGHSLARTVTIALQRAWPPETVAETCTDWAPSLTDG